MKAPRKIPDSVRDRQTQASDPETSAFVSANAGAGKTHVLVNRIIRLLLKGTPPQKILCITFTKAAAANMAERVFATLGRWIALPDDALDTQLKLAGIARPDTKTRERARKLFASALETPGGLKVQTIHALCTRLLQQFPFEAGVPARFTVTDDTDRAAMMERASLAVLLAAAANPDSAGGRALATAITGAADQTFRDVVRDACTEASGFIAWLGESGSIETAIERLHATLGLNPGDTLAQIEREIVDGPHFSRDRWSATAELLRQGSKTDNAQADRLCTARLADGGEQIETYLTVFLTGDKEFRKSIITQKLAKALPSLAAAFSDEAVRLERLIDRRRAAAARDRSVALLTIASAVATHYRHEKNERGLLDYDDLIDKTLAMLRRTASGWVHYKLDQGVDHVLIDEAQDTSPKQWEIISQIVDDFFSGAGARDGLKRTIFAVGDEKQSIFSFQGAAPQEFDNRKRVFHQGFDKAGLAFESISFNYSFRSGHSILKSVESTFAVGAAFHSITSDRDGMPAHLPLDDAAPSVVELWELETPDEKQDIEGWSAPFDAVSETSPEARLAGRMASQIARMIAEREPVGRDAERRPMRPGDVLILVRRRGKLFDAVIQALKRAGVPVAGADRLKLTEHIAIIDLMNLADALLLPSDDLALAVALKSPLFGLSEEQLFTLAYDRGRRSLREALAQRADTDPAFKAAEERLRACEDRAGASTPFAFYSWLLGAERGRARMLARLNHEASDALDEFLELALTYEQREPPSLQGFMAWLRAADVEIKRDMEISRDEVRVMTVHGAKGLEAPVVFLMDTTSTPLDNARLSLIRVASTTQAPACVVWAGRKADDPASVATAREKMLTAIEDEYRRLLYVAMTRAAERLIVGGCLPGNRKNVRDGSWYDLIKRGLDNSGLARQEMPSDAGPVLRYARPEDTTPPAPEPQPSAVATDIALPPWLTAAAAPGGPAPTLLRPSGDDDRLRFSRRPGETAGERQRAMLRGSLVHRLLQSLPALAPEHRADAAARYLARHVRDWNPDERDALAAQMMSMIADARFAALFAAGSRAEVPIVGRLERPGRTPLEVSGQIDRLIATDAEVLIADYKTNQTPPRHLAEVPAAYLRQLALYRAVLAKLYPARPVRAVLVWTEAPDMMEISAETLDLEMARIISP
ncbi:MAG: double-strand break repair helicase AddA [Xanthobacteraceae bacterium]